MHWLYVTIVLADILLTTADFAAFAFLCCGRSVVGRLCCFLRNGRSFLLVFVVLSFFEFSRADSFASTAADTSFANGLIVVGVRVRFICFSFCTSSCRSCSHHHFQSLVCVQFKPSQVDRVLSHPYLVSMVGCLVKRRWYDPCLHRFCADGCGARR